MLAKPLYEKPKPAANSKAPGRQMKQRSFLPHILVGASLILLVILMGAAFFVSVKGANTDGEDTAAKQNEPSETPTQDPGSTATAPSAPKTAGLAATQAAKPAKTPASSDLKLDAFRYPVISESDAAERMKQILSYFEKGDAAEKRAAYKALIDMGPFAPAPLRTAIEKADARSLTWLAMAAAQLKVTVADRPLIEQAGKAGGKVDGNVILSIGKLATPAAREFCIDSMKQSSNQKLREAAWEAFTHCASPDDIPLLLSALEKGELYQQERSAQALGRLGRNPAILPQIVPSLEKALSQGEASPHRMAYARAIASLPSNEVQTLLTGLLFDRNADVRVLGVKGLGSQPSTMGIMLSSLRNEADLRVLKAAAECLAEHPYEMATPKLLDWVNSTNADLSGAAYRALIAAYGHDLGYRSGPWETWLRLGEKEGDPNRSKLFMERQRKAQAEKQNQNALLALGR